MKETVIWDIDNCLSDDSWRIKYIDRQEMVDMDKKFAQYHERCGGDAAGNEAIFQLLCAVTTPVFLTARPEAIRDETVGWIRSRLGIRYPILYMRPDGCYDSSVTLKQRMLGEVTSKRHVRVAFDDREDIVKMYRAMGVNSARLWIHEEEYWPQHVEGHM